MIARRRLLQGAGASALAAGLPPVARATAIEPGASLVGLARAFADPPAEARPGVFWYWMNGVVTRAGITADLEAMATAGIGRAILFTIGLGAGATGMKTYPSLTPEWWDMIGFAIAEAGRVGVAITMGACDGWATAGGPWITPDLSMQRICWSETRVAGGTRLAERLPQPPTAMGHYRDVATVAFPMPPAWSTSVERAAAVTTSFALPDPGRLNVHAGGTALDTVDAGWIEFAFDPPFTLRGVVADGPDGGAGAGLIVEASDDGHRFRRVGTLAQADETTLAARRGLAPPGQRAATAYVIADAPATTARRFRIRFAPGPPDATAGGGHFAGPTGDPVTAPAPARLRLTRLVLLDEAVIPDHNLRVARTWSLPPALLSEADVPADACVAPADIVDLTDRIGSDGAIDWTPPGQGVWKIVRVGHTSTGAINGTGFPAGRGLESDKMNPAATRVQFDHWLGELARRSDKRQGGRALTTMHTDSWESGAQNWTPDFPAEFRRRRGYELMPWLAIMAGVPIADADTVDRVLTDIRRTIGEATADHFFGELARLGRNRGYDYSAEPANPIYPIDPLIFAKYADRPMGEFWIWGDDKPSDIADAIHGGHVYGRRVIGAEAFTEFAMQWTETPYSCKPLGDANWAKGVNQLTCHVWAAQPWTDRAHEPGMTLANIGVFFSRTNIWWDMARPWFAYLARGQALLQQGRPIADVACYIGEETPARAYVPANTPLPIPDGHAFDSINTDALMTRATVRDGWIVLPEGQRYAALLLPCNCRMSQAVLRRIAALVQAGATVIGPPPAGRIGLAGDAAAVAALIGALWGGPGLNRHGAGRIGDASDLTEVLQACGCAPDCTILAPRPAADALSPIMWTHRAGDGWDLYFFSNQGDTAQQLRARLRATGRIAELWDADTGEVRRIDRTGSEIALTLDPCGSAFVVLHDGPTRAAAQPVAVGEPIPITGPWRVTFARGLDGPRTIRLDRLCSWTTLADDDLRHYAGTATYETSFAAPPGAWRLDLGDVAELCEVELNGRLLRRLWKPPFTADLGDVLRAGANRLVVRVANSWRNRLVGDAGKPPAARRSFTVTPFFTGRPSPLPGPPDPAAPTTDANGIFLGGGYGNDAGGVPLRGTAAGTPPARLRQASRFGFPGGGATAPGPDMRRTPDADGLVVAGLLGPVRLVALG